MTHSIRIWVIALVMQLSAMADGLAGDGQKMVSIEEEYRFVAGQWMGVSKDLKGYGGLASFCTNEEIREYADEVLDLVQRYNVLVQEILTNPNTNKYCSKKEYGRLLKKLRRFSKNYSGRSFAKFMNDNCLYLRELETKKVTLTKVSGIYSLDSQLYLMHTLVYRYMRRMEKHVGVLEKSVRLLHPQHKEMPQEKLLARL